MVRYERDLLENDKPLFPDISFLCCRVSFLLTLCWIWIWPGLKFHGRFQKGSEKRENRERIEKEKFEKGRIMKERVEISS